MKILKKILGNLPPCYEPDLSLTSHFPPALKFLNLPDAPLPLLAFISAIIIIIIILSSSVGDILCVVISIIVIITSPTPSLVAEFKIPKRCSNRPTLPCRDFGAITIFSTTIISAPTTLK